MARKTKTVWRSRIVGHGKVAPGELVANPMNWRTHPRHQRQALEGVLAEVGWVQSVIVNRTSGNLVDGHLRVELALAHGESEIDVIYVELDEREERLVLASLDPLGALAATDEDMLRSLLNGLETTDDALAQLLAQLLPAPSKGGLVDEDDVPEPPDDPTTQPGDLWILGDHRLLCGDSGSVEDLDRLLAGAEVDLLNTDPPYNVKVEPRSNNAIAAGMSKTYDASYQDALEGSKRKKGVKALDAAGMHHAGFDVARKKTGLGHTQQFDNARGKVNPRNRTKMRAKDRPLVNDFVTDEAFILLLDAWFGNAQRVMGPGRSFYIWGGYANVANYPPAMIRAGFYFSQAIIWVKEHPVLTRKDFMGNHEWCFYGWKHDAGHRFFGPANIADVWSVKKVNPNAMVHLTEKPVELARLAIEYSSLPGEVVLDLFGGSGSTLIACEMTGRKGYLMEMDPAYCDVIVERYKAFTGTEPVLDLSGRKETNAWTQTTTA